MKYNFLLLLTCLTLLTSCHGQTSNKIENIIFGETITHGDTVGRLGEHLWYVFQDSKNNYWFGSDGEGVYRFDGKTIINFSKKHGLCNTVSFSFITKQVINKIR